MCREVANAMRSTSGPIHINIPQRGRITSLDADQGWTGKTRLPADRDDVAVTVPATPRKEPAALARDIGLRPGMRGLIVAGPFCPLSNRTIGRFAETIGYPLLADAPSGLRRPAVPNVITVGDVLAIGSGPLDEAPEVIVQLGSAPVSHAVHQFLAAQSAPLLRIDRRAVDRDFLRASFHQIVDPDPDMLDELAQIGGPGDEQWLAGWKRRARQVAERRDAFLATADWGEYQAVSMVCAAAGFDFLHLANSMATRHGNLFCDATRASQPIYANRGVNGIDGTVSTFVGECIATDSRGLLLIGDQSMLYDVQGLEAADETRGCIVILNNGGASIFDIAVPAQVDVRRFLRRPNRTHFAAVAAAFDVSFERVKEAAALRLALERARESDRMEIIEVVVPPASLARQAPKLIAAMLAVGT
jgi:2-succinyl-5-enolpyruvyl-6-hydroxy-3-cyclohexene-1-carboxylate synthase